MKGVSLALVKAFLITVIFHMELNDLAARAVKTILRDFEEVKVCTNVNLNSSTRHHCNHLKVVVGGN